MSLLKDVSSWAKTTVLEGVTFSISMIIIACLLLIALPKIINPNSPRYRDIDSKLAKKSMKSQDDISAELSRQIEDTKLRLIFRTHADLAKRLKIPQSDVILNGVENKTWRDTALECIASDFPGVNPITLNPQLKNVKGWRIVYKVGRTNYEYNTSTRGDWVLCSKIEIPDDIAEQNLSPYNF